ncbi:hypothetical protein AOZ06_04210 [Kibdelosporangium phytohabitans]|uniref:Uncharacterized protein n=1 Tax=Kibdelosporangium phytohabitans TaxID=860235 RepID=A0A0N9HVR9_9PSEU|nr:hypothetical protein AOZ06_04210 [Kibdelosporangium phytohabitans]
MPTPLIVRTVMTPTRPRRMVMTLNIAKYGLFVSDSGECGPPTASARDALAHQVLAPIRVTARQAVVNQANRWHTTG